MARGWESKAVEQQIGEREEASPKNEQRKRSKGEAERILKRESLILARTRTASNLQTATDGRYRQLLERTLAHLDSELAGLGK